MNIDEENFDEENFIESHVKFLYGKYYAKALNNEIIYIKKNTNGNHIDFLLSDITNLKDINSLEEYVKDKCDKYKYTGWSPIFILKYFYQFYNDKKKNTILRINLHDGPYTNNCKPYYGCYIGHNRYIPYETNKPIITPCFWHLNIMETIKSKNDTDFYSKKDMIIFRDTTDGNIEFPKREYNTTIRFQIISNNFNKYNIIDIGFSKLTIHSRDDDSKFLKENLSLNEIFSYKFVLCIGGNDISPMFPQVLALSNCCPFHTYPFDFEDYYLNDLKPYVHFIPIKIDGSDLKRQYDWCMDNLEKCKNISENGSKYMEKYANSEIYNKIIERFCELYPIIKYK
jgi:hypothetical protein